MNILASLQALADADYKKFHSGLIPTVPQEKILGVRTPALRQLAKKLHGTAEAESFLWSLPHVYYDENQLHAILLSDLPDYAFCLQALEQFLPYVDNWATCDIIKPKVLRHDLQRLLPFIKKCLHSDEEFTIRCGLNLLMSYYLDTAFTNEYLEWVVEVKSDKYYVKMMQAWFFATALAKQYDASVVYLKEHKLSAWVQQKTIQKACESYRISSAEKAYLHTLRDK